LDKRSWTGSRRFPSTSESLRSFCDAGTFSRARRTDGSRNAEDSRAPWEAASLLLTPALLTRGPLGEVGRDPDVGDPGRAPRPGDAGRPGDPGRPEGIPGRPEKGREPFDLVRVAASGAGFSGIGAASWEPLHSQDRPDDNSGSARAMLGAVVEEDPSLSAASACFSRRISRPKRFRSPMFMPRAATT